MSDTDLHVEVHGEIIVITQPEMGFYAIYDKPTHAPELTLKGPR
jgi:hypothetical protein